MIKVVWGTGFFASKFIGFLENDDIEFFIDSSEEKWGTIFLNREVKNPNDITNWAELCVYIQYNYYEEIAAYLKNKGLVEGLNYVKYNETMNINVKNIDEECNDFISRISLNIDKYKNKVICWNDEVARPNHFAQLLYFQKMFQAGVDWLLVSDAVYIDEKDTQERSPFPFIILPSICGNKTCPNIKQTDFINDEHIQYIKKRDTLNSIAILYRAQYKGINIDYAYECVYHMYWFMKRLLELLAPSKIFILYSFSVAHRVLAEVCHDCQIPVVFTHMGVLYGTYAYDIDGEMGESLPARYANAFNELYVTDQEIYKASQVWNYLYKNKLNRRVQVKTNIMEIVKQRISATKPIIFCAGQNDCGAGMIPFCDYSRKYHSPNFKTSFESIVYLGHIAFREGWNIIYKPHPLTPLTKEEKKKLPTNVILVEQGNIYDLIEYADVTVTILSSTAYEALIKKKPVVMLGYNQLKSKGCTYDAFNKREIVSQIKKAIHEGFTIEQQNAFLKHIAQLLKYYLYDDMNEREIRYGRPIPQTVDELYELSDLLGGEWTEK